MSFHNAAGMAARYVVAEETVAAGPPPELLDQFSVRISSVSAAATPCTMTKPLSSGATS